MERSAGRPETTLCAVPFSFNGRNCESLFFFLTICVVRLDIVVTELLDAVDGVDLTDISSVLKFS